MNYIFLKILFYEHRLAQLFGSWFHESLETDLEQAPMCTIFVPEWNWSFKYCAARNYCATFCSSLQKNKLHCEINICNKICLKCPSNGPAIILKENCKILTFITKIFLINNKQSSLLEGYIFPLDPIYKEYLHQYYYSCMTLLSLVHTVWCCQEIW